MDLLLGVASTVSAAVVPSTNDRSDRAWRRRISFLASAGIQSDHFLDGFTISEGHWLLAAFAHAVRTCTYSRSTRKDSEALGASVCRSTIGAVARAFRVAERPDPQRTAAGKTSLLLSRLFKAYENEDPGIRQQKCLGYSTIQDFFQQPTVTIEQEHVQDLIMLAFYFAMRSCEYIDVYGPEKPTLFGDVTCCSGWTTSSWTIPTRASR